MKDVNSPNDQVQWATDKTTINSISYKRACNTDLSSLHTLLLVVKTKDHIGLNDLHRTDDHRYFKCHNHWATHRIELIIIKKNKHWRKPIGMAINTTSHSYSLGQNSSGEISNAKKPPKKSKKGF